MARMKPRKRIFTPPDTPPASPIAIVASPSLSTDDLSYISLDSTFWDKSTYPELSDAIETKPAFPASLDASDVFVQFMPISNLDAEDESFAALMCLINNIGRSDQDKSATTTRDEIVGDTFAIKKDTITDNNHNNDREYVVELMSLVEEDLKRVEWKRREGFERHFEKDQKGNEDEVKARAYEWLWGKTERKKEEQEQRNPHVYRCRDRTGGGADIWPEALICRNQSR